MFLQELTNNFIITTLAHFKHPKYLSIKDFTYELPANRIAQIPLGERDSSRLLIYKNGEMQSDNFINLSSYIPDESLLILNNTRVINARILFDTAAGKQVEIFCLEPVDEKELYSAFLKTGITKWLCLIGNKRKWKEDILSKIFYVNSNEYILKAKIIEKLTDSFIIEFEWSKEIIFGEVLNSAGVTPLPPYIKRKAVDEDKSRYQTVYANTEGSVAAPTAGLHFTDRVFASLKNKNIDLEYLTLHVGAGTFKPVKTPTLELHDMHLEKFLITKNLINKLYNAPANKIICVGTTSLRAVESLYYIGCKICVNQNLTEDNFYVTQWEPYDEITNDITKSDSLSAIINFMEKNGKEFLNCTTSLLIAPGFEFKFTNSLITNFHLPGSTLLLLVSAFAGDNWKKIYEYALSNNFRFLSYGDSSFIIK